MASYSAPYNAQVKRSTDRIASIAALSFASGLPLGLIWIALPDWLRSSGTDLRWVGLLTLTQLPWTLKFLWSPLMDRFVPPLLGRRRGWIVICQLALALGGLGLAAAADASPSIVTIFALALGISFAAASHDIAIDAYVVDVLPASEHGIAVGLRTALYRAAMLVAGALSIWAAGSWGWRSVQLVLALLWIPLLAIAWRAPAEPRDLPRPRTLREAVWAPFMDCLARPRALEILAFVVLYKLSDNLSQSLLRPFLFDMGYSATDRGLWLGLLGLIPTLLGTFAGGLACNRLGLGRALWIFGFLQIFSNIGYLIITQHPGSRGLMFAALTFELATTGLGMGAFGVFLLRLTRKRFSATQYALFSSLFGLPRALAGPVTGFAVEAFGWPTFFWGTMIAGLPGLWMLHRFCPWHQREPEIAPGDEMDVPFQLSLPPHAIRTSIFGALTLPLAASVLQAGMAALEGSSTGFVREWMAGWQFQELSDLPRFFIRFALAMVGAIVAVALSARKRR